ncbi:MAG: glycosyltransferase family 4 protein [Janthinobacterium lividum]
MTDLNNIVVTGDAGFMRRYQIFHASLADRCTHLECLVSGDAYNNSLFGTIVRGIYNRTPLISRDKNLRAGILHKRKAAFLRKSRQTEQKIARLSVQPDLVLHMFGMYAPFLHPSPIPFTMTLDFTMALAVKEWPAWAPFQTDKARRDWLDTEGDAFRRAAHLFPWSNLVKQSLMNDYGVPEDKITVIGSSGNFRTPYDGAKTFGSHQIIFNGTDWDRKGGDIVVDAFRKVRQTIPDAKLVIIGTKTPLDEPGVETPGYITSATGMQDLFLASDLVVAPARCEPYGGFLVEGMNYGVPCIVSDRGAMFEIVDHDVNGLVLPELTADCLAESIVSLLRDMPRLERFSASARNKVKTQLNWDAIAAKMFDALSRKDLPVTQTI